MVFLEPLTEQLFEIVVFQHKKTKACYILKTKMRCTVAELGYQLVIKVRYFNNFTTARWKINNKKMREWCVANHPFAVEDFEIIEHQGGYNSPAAAVYKAKRLVAKYLDAGWTVLNTNIR